MIPWRWCDWVIETLCGLLMIVAFCWGWKNIMQVPDGLQRSGVPNPFAWWLFLPVYLVSLVYFALRFRQIVRPKRHQLPAID